MFEVVERGQKQFPLERAVLVSIGAHLLVLIALFAAPERDHSKNRGGLLAPLIAELDRAERERKEPPIPIVFRESPGPARENPRRSDFSDADRRAGGGDPARSRSLVPFYQPKPGIEGREGPRRAQAGAEPALPVPPRSGSGPESDGRDAAAIFGPPAASDSTSPVFPRAETQSGEKGRLASLDQAIREAARGASGGGEGGAGFPSPEGGFVDSGPLSFDTTWYDWGPYAAEMVRRIKMHWEIPELARLGWKGKLTIRFFILADGRVADAQIIKRSGVPPFDFAALQAILKSSPFRPLPEDLGSSREGVTVTFFYNIRPEREAPPAGSRPEGSR